MKHQVFIVVLVIFLFNSCKMNTKKNDEILIENDTQETAIALEKILANLENSNDNKIMVIAHRGDWRNAPENSIQAIQNCIDLGVDMVEIDVRKTKDNQLVLMHDETLDRTTTGKGYVSDWTLDSLQKLFLKNEKGIATSQKIPTLKEALLTSKNKILVNLDKCYDYFAEVYRIIQETGTARQVVIKGENKSYEDVRKDFGSKLDSILFMPIINLDKQANASEIIRNYQLRMKPKAIEIVFSVDTSSVLNNFSAINSKGSKVWVNSLWKSMSAGYDDDSALKNPDSIYGWYVKKGINMIQTDRPALLLSYLRSKGLHE